MPPELVERTLLRLLAHFHAGPAGASSFAAGDSLREVLAQVAEDPGTAEAVSEAVLQQLSDAEGDARAEQTLTRLAEIYGLLAQQLAAHPARPLGALELVPVQQRGELLHTFNATAFHNGFGDGDDASYKEATLNELFADCTRKFADRRAITYQGTTLTYAQLERRTLALAQRLLREALPDEAVIAIALEPSIEVVVAMLGALRAGAAYVPIDATQPRQRIRELLEDCGAAALIASRELAGELAFRGVHIDLQAQVRGRGCPEDQADPRIALWLDCSAPPPRTDEPTSLPAVSAGDCAYLLYTSGTTGRPKGVIIEHRCLVNYVTWFRHHYGIDSSHVAALLTSHAFDLGYTTLWTTLLSGGELHLLPEALRADLPALARYLAEHRISFLKLTPSLLGALLGVTAFTGERYRALRLLVCGGEPIRPADLERFYARFPEALAVNHYGPTETTIGVVTQPIERARLPDFTRRPVLGRPIGNARAYVTTAELQLLPIGAIGELLIGGRPVGRGYLGRPELTREKFLADPFSQPSSPTSLPHRVYRTGDLARWTSDGALELLGRADRQLKVRGYRVEPAEIEQAMIRHLGVREAVVIEQRRSEAHQVLCAYYVGAARLRDDDARRQLASVLPEPMVPACFVRVAELPRSANGKLDVARLPAPTMAPAIDLAIGSAIEPTLGEALAPPPADPPQSPTERTLLAMWSALFGLPPEVIGVSRNFFALGGHSLLMIQLLAEIDERFGRELPLDEIFGEGTVRSLARALDGGAR